MMWKKCDDVILLVCQGPGGEELSGWRQQRAEDQWFWDESSGGWRDLFIIWAQTNSHQMDCSRSSQLWWNISPVSLGCTIAETFHTPWFCVFVADVSCTVIDCCRSLQLRERCVELRHPPVGDLQSGYVSLSWDDQSAGSRAGGER